MITPKILRCCTPKTCALPLTSRGGDIYPLFTMTPYFYRTKKERAARLSALDALTVTLDFELRVYKKESC